MKTTTWLLGLIFGTLSIVMLIKHGFDVSFVSSIQIVLDYYEQATQMLFGWAEPWIKQALSALQDWIGWKLTLYPHWKHVLIITWLYFGAVIRNAWYRRGGFQPSIGAVAITAFAVALSILAAVLSGSFDPADARFAALIAAPPILAISAFNLTVSWIEQSLGVWERDSVLMGDRRQLRYARLTFVASVAALLVAAIATQFSAFQALPGTGLALLLTLVLLYSFGLVWRWLTMLSRGRRGMSRAAQLEMSEPGHTRIGLFMLSSLVGAAIFLAANAGLKLAGL